MHGFSVCVSHRHRPGQPLVQGHSTSKDELDHFLDHLRMQKKETTTVPESLQDINNILHRELKARNTTILKQILNKLLSLQAPKLFKLPISNGNGTRNTGSLFSNVC